jgi:PhnB protein
MMAKVKAVPQGYRTITPNLVCRDSAAAIEFYKKVFNATEKVRMQGPDGKIAHAELQIGDSSIFLNDPMQHGPGTERPASPSLTHLHLYLENVDDFYNRAVDAGAKIIMPLQDMFWGDRYGLVEDPFGQRWSMATHIEDVSSEEMKKRQKAMFAKAAG